MSLKISLNCFKNVYRPHKKLPFFPNGLRTFQSHFRFIEIPLIVRYYFFPEKIQILSEFGFRNQFVLNNEETNSSYGLGIRYGGGIEYNLNRNIALQLLIEHNRGIINFFDESVFKVDYLAFGIVVLKRL